MSILPVTNSYRLSGSLNGISHSVLEMALSHLLDIYRAIGASQYLPVPKRACSRLTPFPVARLLRTCWFVNRVRDCHDFLPLRYKDGTTLLFKPSTEISAMFILIFQLLVPRFITVIQLSVGDIGLKHK